METGPSLVDAIVLGIVEGLTEFLPVSSTGHLILAGWFLGFEGPKAEVFHVAIQVGAILAVCGLYFARLWKAVTGLAGDPAARRFALSVILAFLPAATLGVLLHPLIKMLFSPTVVDPGKDFFAPAIAITALDLLLKVGNNAWRAAADMSMYAMLAMGVYLLFALIRWPFERLRQKHRQERAAAASADEPTLREVMQRESAAQTDTRIDQHGDRRLRIEPRL